MSQRYCRDRKRLMALEKALRKARGLEERGSWGTAAEPSVTATGGKMENNVDLMNGGARKRAGGVRGVAWLLVACSEGQEETEKLKKHLFKCVTQA